MKTIDTFFKFPLRVFDPLSSRQAQKRIERSLDSEFAEAAPRERIEHAKGHAYLPYHEARNISFHDTFLPHRDVADVKARGFDSTVVICPMMGDVISVWPLEKFAQEYGDYMDRMNDYLDSEEKRRQAEQRAAYLEDERRYNETATQNTDEE